MVERVRAVREGFFELPINAKAFERRSLTAQLLSEIDLGYETGVAGAHLVDQQVRIDCARPAGATVAETPRYRKLTP
ncbi:hypothetical protein [Nonomuraea sp. NPDC049695]|uniref:hypothetical protein n=1 Tax=Nonomuraea sp. NPDC049695 TaxID=3154734 RepID=UPI0034385C57